MSSKTPIKHLLLKASNYLRENNIKEYQLEAEILLMYVLNKTKEELYLSFDKGISKTKINTYLKLLKRRAIKKEPIQYITKKVEFFGLEFYLNKYCFIPRPETEILVEAVINKIYRLPLLTYYLLLDLCCGCGNIAISLAKNINNLRVVASDISPEVVKVAKFNAKKHNVEDKIDFLVADLFTPLNNKFDMIISNPPYIKNNEIKNLSKEIHYEPQLSINGGGDGLIFYKRILTNIEQYLKKDGYLICEIGNNKHEIYKLFKNKFCEVEIIKDYSNQDRVIIGSELVN